MTDRDTGQPVFRFAPSPNGALHLGHAYSAILCHDRARALGGRFLIRFEDIDTARCTYQHAEAILEDLAWLGLSWDEAPLFQSDRFALYKAHADKLSARGLVYPCPCSRGDIARAVSGRADWPRDPDGAILYPGTHRPHGNLPTSSWTDGSPTALRLHMARALAVVGGRKPLSWDEGGRTVTADAAVWGDTVLVRKETPASYHLAAVVDDALQGVTHVVRGHDLYPATALHRLLQELFGFAAPRYWHHALILDAAGRKLSKSDRDTSLRALRETGWGPGDVRRRIGL